MGTKKVLVGKLSKDVRKSDLKELFSRCGKVVDVFIDEKKAIIVRILGPFGFLGLDPFLWEEDWISNISPKFVIALATALDQLDDSKPG